MQVILTILAALFLGILALMAYAMLFTVLLVLGVVLALVALLVFGLQQAEQGHYGLLVAAALVWVLALAAVLAARRSR